MDWSQRETIEEYGRLERMFAGDPRGLKGLRRDLGKQDLYYLMTSILGRVDMHHPWIFQRCREVQTNPDETLDLWAREHYKSTIITYGNLILEVINNPEITIGIFSHTKDIATDFVQAIKVTCETNMELRSLYADVFYDKPRTKSPQWTNEAITVKRKSVRKEPTISAHGLVDGMPTGYHLDIRLYDDIVTEKSVSNPNMIKKTTECWASSTNLGTDGGVARYAGTYYHLHDTYHVMQERGVKTRIYPATADGSDDIRKSVLKTPEYLAKKRAEQGVYIFSCQQLLNPLADSVQGFREEWWRTWGASNDRNLTKLILVDPSSGKRGKQGNADNDYTAMWVLGLGGDGNWYVLDLVRDRMSLTKRGDMLMELHRKYRPRRVGYEEYGMQADIEYIERLQDEQNYRFKITPLGGALSKPDRIKRLVPLFEAGKIYMPISLVRKDWEGKAVDVIRTFKDEEYSKFPVLVHDDMLDALSRICDDEIKNLPPPSPQPEGYNALKEIRRNKRRNRPVV